MSGVRLLIPLKARHLAKSRFAAHLSPAQREALRHAMLEDLLDGLAPCIRPGGITLYGPDRETARTAQARGLGYLRQPPGVAGLNASLSDGVARLAAGGAQVIAVLPGDLPVLDPAELDGLLARVAADGHCAVVPNLDRDGTNCLAFPAATPPAFGFGPGSFGFHMSAPAPERRAWLLPSLARDIDTPDDLARLSREPATARGRRTRALALSVGLMPPRPVESAGKDLLP